MPSRLFQRSAFQPDVFQSAPMLGVFQPGVFQPGVFQAIPTQGRTAPALPKGAIAYHPQPAEDEDGIAAVVAALVRAW